MIVRKLRLRKGWSQEQLADASGLSVRTIQRIERGDTPGLETLKSLAAVFETDVSTLREEHDMSAQATPSITPEERSALRHVRKLRGFYIHLMIYAVVICALAALNLITQPRHLWVMYTASGWGVGVLAHGLAVFGGFRLFGPEWERRQVEKRLGRKL
jgi:transcriptional regulator with XRE-family HTH domain